jgi:cytoplasmic iron level regulating protein YaaA (DUF328/UPF0246 family)
MDLSNIEDKLEEIEKKLDNTITQLHSKSYADEMKQKKQFEQWLGVLFNEFKKELKKMKSDFESELKSTKQEIVKEIKNGNKR